MRLITSKPKKFFQYQQSFGKGQATSGFVAKAMHFDGASYIRTTQPYGLTTPDGKSYLASIWVRQSVVGGWALWLDNTTSKGFSISKDPSDLFTFFAGDSAGSNAATLGTATAISDVNVWHHLLASVDTTISRAQLYVDGVSVSSNFFQNSNNINFSVATTISIGARDSGVSFGAGDISEIFVAFNQSLDLSVPANVAKFRSASGHPVDLGTNGLIPTGVAPTAYFSVRNGVGLVGVPNDFLINRGSGGLQWYVAVGSIPIGSVDP